jgi:hypothetical protein
VTRVDDVWIQAIRPFVTVSEPSRPLQPRYVRADAIIQLNDAEDAVWARTAGHDSDSGSHVFAPASGCDVDLLQTIAEARELAREQRSAVIVSWLDGVAGWRTETADAHQIRLQAERRS